MIWWLWLLVGLAAWVVAVALTVAFFAGASSLSRTLSLTSCSDRDLAGSA